MRKIVAKYLDVGAGADGHLHCERNLGHGSDRDALATLLDLRDD